MYLSDYNHFLSKTETKLQKNTFQKNEKDVNQNEQHKLLMGKWSTFNAYIAFSDPQMNEYLWQKKTVAS